MSVKNDLKSLKRKVQKRGYVPVSGLSPHELHERARARTLARMLALINGEPMPEDDYLEGEREDLSALYAPYEAESANAPKVFIAKIRAMAERRDERDRREAERLKERQDARAEIVNRDRESEPENVVEFIRNRRAIG